MSDILNIITTRILLICLFILVSGISAGLFFASILPSSEASHLISYLSEATDSTVISQLFTNLTLLFLIVLAGFSVYGFPLAIILLWSRGFSVGFCDYLQLYNIEDNSIAGFIFSFLLPQLMICTIYLLAAAISTGYAMRHLHTSSR